MYRSRSTANALRRVVVRSRCANVPRASLLTRYMSDAPSTTSSSTPPPPPLPPSTEPQTSRYRRFLQTIGRLTLITVLAGAGTFYYYSQRDKHPGAQLPFDPTKKTIVVLGSGWGASSMLKNLDTEDYNVIVISPKNYFLFTPLLPSVAVGTLNPRSILQPTRYITRHKKRVVSVVEAEAESVDPIAKTVTFNDISEIKGEVAKVTIPYDYLVYAVGAETQTFGIKGVKEYACFMKELADAERMQRVFMDCIETAAFPGQTKEEIERLLHVIVVGGGPTGVELSGELHDFLNEDLLAWYPELAPHIKLTLVEALPSVLPMFSKQLIDYTESTFKESKIEVLTKTMVKEVKEDNRVVLAVKGPDGKEVTREVPFGVLVWAAGNTGRKITRDLMAQFPKEQTNRRGITIDDHLIMAGSNGSIFAIGDCTATQYAPTAQVASQQGAYLARVFKQMAKRDEVLGEIEELKVKTQQVGGVGVEGEGEGKKKVEELEKKEKQLERVGKFRPFRYSHQGSLAYIGSEKAIADLPIFNGNLASGGMATFLFWRSAYLSTLFSLRNRTLVASDWLKVRLFGRDVSRE